MQVYLNKNERDTVERYRKYLSRVANIRLPFRHVLNRIIAECADEIDMCERDLVAESRRAKEDCGMPRQQQPTGKGTQ